MSGAQLFVPRARCARVDARKAYGVVTALGTKLGEAARERPGLLDALRACADAEAFRARVREEARGLVPDALVETFLSEVVTEADWQLWRSRLLVQLKMVRDGARPAPGHEAGKGVGRP